MTQTIFVVAFCLLEFLGFKLSISIVFQSECDLDELLVAHHPPRWSAITDLNELNSEDKGRVRGNSRRRSYSTVSVFASDRKLGFLAQLHRHDTNIPTFDNLANSDYYFKSLTIVTAVENSAVGKATFIVDKDLLSLFRD